jgi:Rps23 Pro-64 3,4-dihydroxylase Tpa1-like proline 4-hydroxylase
MNKVELFPGVVLYKNILEDPDSLHKEIKENFLSGNWKHDTHPDHRNPGTLVRSYYEYVLNKNDSEAISIMEKIKPLELALEQYCKDYDVELFKYEASRAMAYEPGCFFGAHKDDMLTLYRRVSTVYYVNDGYSGGEIYFPLINLTVKPEKNQFLIFPSAYLFVHQVSEVSDDTRFAVVGFAQ